MHLLGYGGPPGPRAASWPPRPAGRLAADREVRPTRCRRFLRTLLAGGVLLLPGIVQPADLAYTISTVAGSDWVGDGGPASQAVLFQAEGVAVDGAGNLFVADALGNRVRQVSPAGGIRTIAGTGVRGASGDGGP